jgi:hypothetical protein
LYYRFVAYRQTIYKPILFFNQDYLCAQNQLSGAIMKTDAQLTWIAEIPSNPAEKRIAALEELKLRKGGLNEYQQSLYERLIKENPEVTVDKNTFRETDDQLPLLFPRWSIFLFTLIASPFVGSLLMSFNFYKTGHKQVIAFCVLFGLTLTILGTLLGYAAGIENIRNVQFIGNIVSAVILDQIFWIRYYGKDFNYRKKTIWAPLGIILVISILLSLYMLNQGELAN